jgi:glycosyltransferase involved in cell wall biosynthesis
MIKTKLFFITYYNIHYTQTSQKNDMTFCEGFSENNCDVEMIFPNYLFEKAKGYDLELNSIFEGYGIKTKFILNKYNSRLFSKLNVFYIFGLAIYSIRTILKYFKIRKTDSKTILIVRSPLVLLLSVFFRKISKKFKMVHHIFWMHEYKNNFYWNYIIKNSNHIIATNSEIKKDVIKFCSYPSDRISLSLNPITQNQLNSIKSKVEARKILNLDENEIYIVYTGKLVAGIKEISLIIEAAKLLKNYKFILTGGRESVIDYYEDLCRVQNIKNIIFTGFIKKYFDVRLYQFCADILVSYYTDVDHLLKYNLPNKISEYMLTKNVIITPDFPATRDLLNQSNCKFVEPNDVTSLKKGIEFLVNNPQKRKELGINAFEKIKDNTYKKITAKIMQEIR